MELVKDLHLHLLGTSCRRVLLQKCSDPGCRRGNEKKKAESVVLEPLPPNCGGGGARRQGLWGVGLLLGWGEGMTGDRYVGDVCCLRGTLPRAGPAPKIQSQDWEGLQVSLSPVCIFFSGLTGVDACGCTCVGTPMCSLPGLRLPTGMWEFPALGQTQAGCRDGHQGQ